MSLTTPIFIERDASQIISEMVARYEQLTGKTLQPAQPERLLLNTYAYRELLLRESIQSAALQNLVDFSSAPVLDYLGALVGVTRLAAAPAECTIRFTLVAGHGLVTIPAGTRVSSVDGVAIFRTKEAANVAVGVNTADVEADCDTPGVFGNGYAIGQISLILDPQAFLSAATNLAATAGGADEETDDHLRDRIKLAPASFSNAGSEGAYKYWAKTANANIVDVAITQPIPGTVNIYPLMASGEVTPLAVLNAVADACNDEKVRPLTDTVAVIAPTRATYTLVVNLTLYNTAIQSDVVSQVTANLNTFISEKRLKLGIDIKRSQIIHEVVIDGVFDATILNGGVAFADLVAGVNEYYFCTSVTVAVAGTTAG
jgi:phage-related baseplate assembly protein